MKIHPINFTLPIYEAPFGERLEDLRSAINQAELLMDLPGLLRDSDNYEGLKDGEFAIGNWIVRPRFK